MNNNERPEVGSAKVPLWVTVMWVLGITWILTYILMGLQRSPFEW